MHILKIFVLLPILMAGTIMCIFALDFFTTDARVGSRISDYYGRTTCKPQKNIYYLKTFKTGSTTMLNILARYSIKNNLRWATYQTRPYEVDTRNPMNSMITRIIPRFNVSSSTKFNIMAEHSRFVESSIKSILEQPSYCFTFLRHPVQQLRSFYYELGGYTDGHTDAVERIYQMSKFQVNQKLTDVYKNIYAKQLGFSESIKDTSNSAYQNHFARVKEVFFVGITDQYTLSLLLLRKKVCFEWQDLIYFHLRKTLKLRDQQSSVEKDSKFMAQHCMFSPLDCHIYRYFNDTFWSAVLEAGQDLQEESKAFEEVLDSVSNYCEKIYDLMKKNKSGDDTLNLWKISPFHIDTTKWSKSFNVTPTHCALMRIEERAFASYFYLKQNPHKCKNYTDTTNSDCPIRDLNTLNMNCSGWCQSADGPVDLMNGLLADHGAYIMH